MPVTADINAAAARAVVSLGSLRAARCGGMGGAVEAAAAAEEEEEVC